MEIQCNMEHYNGIARVIFHKYNNGGIAIQLMGDEGPVCMATVWVSGLEEGEVAVKNYSENRGVLQTLVRAGIVKSPHRYVESGFVTIPVCMLVEGGK